MTRPASPFAAPPERTRKRSKSPQEPSQRVRAYVRARDNGCVAHRLGMEGMSACKGAVQIDHVRASGGLGMKSPATVDNLVSLCMWHHRLKTEYGKVWRPLLLDYLARVEPAP